MPDKQKHRTKVGDRVVIKDDMTRLYKHARTFSEGVVKKTLHDHLGYPLIAIEWDKDHWAYSGEEDGLVLEAHFDLVEESMAESNENDLIRQLAELVDNYKKGTNGDKVEETAVEDTHKSLSYAEILENGVKDAEKAEAFMLFVAKTEEFDGSELVIPRLYMDAKAEDAGLVLDAAVADYVAQVMTRMIHELVRLGKEQRGDTGS